MTRVYKYTQKQKPREEIIQEEGGQGAVPEAKQEKFILGLARRENSLQHPEAGWDGVPALPSSSSAPHPSDASQIRILPLLTQLRCVLQQPHLISSLPAVSHGRLAPSRPSMPSKV